ncbi:MAG: GNVR domain-containing protein [Gemmatimonadales bacterium]|jgi:uncharacterized protein involved in exopolysaccharide biosynthesis
MTNEIKAPGGGSSTAERGVERLLRETVPRPPRRSNLERFDEEERANLLQLLAILLKRWKLVAGLPIAFAVATAIIVLIIHPRYTAHVVFVPETQSRTLNLPAGLSGLAARFGVSAGAGPSSPRFYADVVESRTLQDQVLLSRLPNPLTAAPDDSAELISILEIEGETEAERLEDGRRVLETIVSVRYNPETSVVNLAVETISPALSADLANRYIALLNRFNLENRQSRVGEKRRFIEERMAAAEAELAAAEETLKTFLESNRQFRGSPELTFEYERLQRRVTIKQDVFTTLRRSYEEARIQEVNDTPLITVIDRAVPPHDKSSPRRRLTVMIAFALGGVLGVFGAFGREFVERAQHRDRDDYEELASRWQGLKTEIAAIWRVVRRRRS